MKILKITLLMSLIFFQSVGVKCVEKKEDGVVLQGLKTQANVATKMDIVCKQINTMISKCRKETKQVLGESSEGGEVVGYFCDGSNSTKIVASFYGEMGKVVDEYYFDKGNVFITRESAYYDQPFYVKGYQIVDVKKQQYSMLGNELFELLPGGKTLKAGNNESNNFSRDIIRFRGLLSK